MKRLLITAVLMLGCLTLALSQSQICELYGTAQGVLLGTGKKQCELFSTDEACNDVYRVLGDVVNLKLESHGEFVEQQIDGCNFIVKEIDGQIEFLINATTDEANRHLENFWSCWEGSTCDSPFFSLFFTPGDKE